MANSRRRKTRQGNKAGNRGNSGKASIRDVQALKGKKTAKRLLATSDRAKRLVQRNKGILLTAYRLIRDNFMDLKNGKPVKAKEILVKRAATGKFKGKKNFFTLLVKAGEWEFFVKVFKHRAEVDIMRGLSLLEQHLRQNHHRVNGIKMVPIRPLILYEDLVSKKSFLVSNFLKESEVEQVSSMKKSRKKKELTKAILNLGLKMNSLHDVWEISDVNAFYHAKTDTVYLFDIYHFKP